MQSIVVLSCCSKFYSEKPFFNWACLQRRSVNKNKKVYEEVETKLKDMWEEKYVTLIFFRYLSVIHAQRKESLIKDKSLANDCNNKTHVNKAMSRKFVVANRFISR